MPKPWLTQMPQPSLKPTPLLNSWPMRDNATPKEDVTQDIWISPMELAIGGLVETSALTEDTSTLMDHATALASQSLRTLP